MHIKFARISASCYLIKETVQMKVGISVNNEVKVQLAKHYFESSNLPTKLQVCQRKGKR